MPHTAARRRIQAALAGDGAGGELSNEERSAFDAEVDASISEAARHISFGEVMAGRGVTTVALDGDGVLTRYFPDGSTERLT